MGKKTSICGQGDLGQAASAGNSRILHRGAEKGLQEQIGIGAPVRLPSQPETADVEKNFDVHRVVFIIDNYHALEETPEGSVFLKEIQDWVKQQDEVNRMNVVFVSSEGNCSEKECREKGSLSGGHRRRGVPIP